MKSKINIGVIFGGRSGEYDVSLMSARSVMAALNPVADPSFPFEDLPAGKANAEKYSITPIGISREGKWFTGDNLREALLKEDLQGLTPVVLLPEPGNAMLYARRESPHGTLLEPLVKLDVIFPVLHGTFGEDGTLQGLFELAEVAYVGAGVLASSVGMDKILFKDLMRTHGIPVVEYLAYSRDEIESAPDMVLETCEKLAAYPLFVKPANMGSSVGISKCNNRSSLFEGLKEAARFDRRILVERGVNGREIELSVLGNNHPAASSPGEICPKMEFYSYEAKYIDDSTELRIPAPLDDETIQQAKETAIRVYQAIDCAGMARVDFLLDRDSGTLYVNEVNTIPGFTSISMYPKLWNYDGISYPELVDRLVTLALERKAENALTVRTYGSKA